MTDITKYKEHYILYDAKEMPSGLWEASATIADEDVEKTARTLMIYNTFTTQDAALGYAITIGKNVIDKSLDENHKQHK